MQQLEARLRVRLLNRTTRKVNVTADGAAYYERVVRLLADLDDAETSLSAAARIPRGRLRVDVPSPLASHLLIPALPGFYARYPEIQLELGVSDRLVDIIGENVDCVVRGGVIRDQSLIARQIADLPLAVFAAPAYLARCGRPTHPQQLEAEPHSTVGFLWSRKVLPVKLRQGAEQVTLLGRNALCVDDGNAYLAAGIAGLGALWLPTYMAEQAVRAGQLQLLFEDWMIEPMALSVAYAPNRHVSAKLRVFIEWISELMAQHAPRQAPDQSR